MVEAWPKLDALQRPASSGYLQCEVRGIYNEKSKLATPLSLALEAEALTQSSPEAMKANSVPWGSRVRVER